MCDFPHVDETLNREVVEDGFPDRGDITTHTLGELHNIFFSAIPPLHGAKVPLAKVGVRGEVEINVNVFESIS